MSIENSEKLIEAITELCKAVGYIDDRISLHERDLQTLKKQRKDYISEKVTFLLPELSLRVLETLRSQENRFLFSGFINQTILNAFMNPGKIFCFFRGKQYRDNLYLVQVQLASYLDKTKYGNLTEIDGSIEKSTKACNELNEKRVQTLETISLLQSAEKANVTLPPEVSSHVERIVTEKQTRESRRAENKKPDERVNSNTKQYAHNNYSVGDDYFDLWFYAITDVPTSFRTLMLDTLHQHNETFNDSSSANNNSAPVIDNTEQSEPRKEDCYDRDPNANKDNLNIDDDTRNRHDGYIPACEPATEMNSTPQSNSSFFVYESAIAIEAAALTLPGFEQSVIATDDSLGAFS